MRKIKEFIKDNQEEVIQFGFYAAGVVMGSYITYSVVKTNRQLDKSVMEAIGNAYNAMEIELGKKDSEIKMLKEIIIDKTK